MGTFWTGFRLDDELAISIGNRVRIVIALVRRNTSSAARATPRFQRHIDDRLASLTADEYAQVLLPIPNQEGIGVATDRNDSRPYRALVPPSLGF